MRETSGDDKRCGSMSKHGKVDSSVSGRRRERLQAERLHICRLSCRLGQVSETLAETSCSTLLSSPLILTRQLSRYQSYIESLTTVGIQLSSSGAPKLGPGVNSTHARTAFLFTHRLVFCTYFLSQPISTFLSAHVYQNLQ